MLNHHPLPHPSDGKPGLFGREPSLQPGLVSVHALSTQINVHESSWFLIRDTYFIWKDFSHATLQIQIL